MTGRGTGKKWTERAAKHREQSEAVEGMQGIVLPVFGGVTMEGLQEKMEAEVNRQHARSIRECVAIEIFKTAICEHSVESDSDIYDAAKFSVKAADALSAALGYSLPQEELKETK